MTSISKEKNKSWKENCLAIKGRISRQVKINIHPQADFRRILHVLSSLWLPDFIIDPENVKYAVLEMLNNSLRAHREKGIRREIITAFSVGDNLLSVSIRDFGGGFDPATLPYDMYGNHNAVNLRDPEFLEYQKRHDYKRFGMGLLLAKRTFPQFELIFLDHEGCPTTWEAGNVHGTLINAAIGAK